MLTGWVAAGGCVAWQYARRRARWTGRRLEMTHDLVERMTGHRTRLAQSSPDRWHEGEDEALDRYLASVRVDGPRRRAAVAAVPRGWLLLGLAGLARRSWRRGLVGAGSSRLVWVA